MIQDEFTPKWEDTKLVKFDDTVIFGHGVCFDGFEYLRLETETPIGRFAIWKEMGGKNIWSAYGGDLGFISYCNFNSMEEASQWVEDVVKDNLINNIINKNN